MAPNLLSVGTPVEVRGERPPTYGFVVAEPQEHVNSHLIRSFQSGRARDAPAEVQDITQIGLDEVLEMYRSFSEQYEREACGNVDPDSFVPLTRKAFVDAVVRRFEQKSVREALRENPVPETGRYLVGGDYSACGPSWIHIAPIIVTPRVGEDELAKALWNVQPDGLPGVPRVSTQLIQIPEGVLQGYHALEVPQDLVARVEQSVQVPYRVGPERLGISPALPK